MGNGLEKFCVKDIAFLAVMAALLFLCGALALPLMTISVFGLRNMATAIFYSLFSVLALMRVRKAGALSLLGLFNGAILLMMSPVMFVTMAASAVLAELLALAAFKTYENQKAVMTAAVLWMVLTLPFSAVFSTILNGQSLAEALAGNPVFVALCCAGTVALGLVGARIGGRIGMELKKAGKLK